MTITVSIGVLLLLVLLGAAAYLLWERGKELGRILFWTALFVLLWSTQHGGTAAAVFR